MTFEEADKIFKSWQNYIEIADKMKKIFSSIPESFLPYPADILADALNIVAKQYLDDGNKRAAEVVQNTISYHLASHKVDEEAMESMKARLDFILNDSKIRKIVLGKLKECQSSWLK